MSAPIEIVSWTETFVDDALQDYMKHPERPFLDTDEVYKLHELVRLAYVRGCQDGMAVANERHNRAKARAQTEKAAGVPQ